VDLIKREQSKIRNFFKSVERETRRNKITNELFREVGIE
jgi:hypothetical protein